MNFCHIFISILSRLMPLWSVCIMYNMHWCWVLLTTTTMLILLRIFLYLWEFKPRCDWLGDVSHLVWFINLYNTNVLFVFWFTKVQRSAKSVRWRWSHFYNMSHNPTNCTSQSCVVSLSTTPLFSLSLFVCLFVCQQDYSKSMDEFSLKVSKGSALKQ